MEIGTQVPNIISTGELNFPIIDWKLQQRTVEVRFKQRSMTNSHDKIVIITEASMSDPNKFSLNST